MLADAAKPASKLRILHVAPPAAAKSKLADALATESDGGLSLVVAQNSVEAMAKLADERFDAVFAHHQVGSNQRGVGGTPDIVAFSTGLRAAGHDHPLVVLSDTPPGELDVACYDAGADAYCCLSQTTPRSLLKITQRAIRQAGIAREYRRLADAEQRRLAQEHREAQRLLAEQRRLVEQLEAVGSDSDSASFYSLSRNAAEESAAVAVGPAGSLAKPYRELLQTYVMMGAGNLSSELTKMVDHLIQVKATGQQAIRLHVSVLEELVQQLGARSTRHVMSRADLLLVELVVHLADGYRRRYDSTMSDAAPPADATPSCIARHARPARQSA